MVRQLPQMIMIHGGNPNTPKLCQRAGWDYGVQFGSAIYAPPVMFDYVQGNWQSYLDALREWRPALALAGDFRDPAEYDMMLDRMADIYMLDILPIVACKFAGAVDMLPETGWRVGVSVPTGHMDDGYIPRWTEVVDRELHLLGGHPDQWAWALKYYYGAQIASIDGNTHWLQAYKYGKMWSARTAKYRELRGLGYHTNALAVASMRNAKRYLESGLGYRPGPRIKACKIRAGILPPPPRKLELFSDLEDTSA